MKPNISSTILSSSTGAFLFLSARSICSLFCLASCLCLSSSSRMSCSIRARRSCSNFLGIRFEQPHIFTFLNNHHLIQMLFDFVRLVTLCKRSASALAFCLFIPLLLKLISSCFRNCSSSANFETCNAQCVINQRHILFLCDKSCSQTRN